jgi:hypothetical protein
LLAYTTADEAVDALELIARDYGRHARASQDLARHHMSAELVLDAVMKEMEL